MTKNNIQQKPAVPRLLSEKKTFSTTPKTPGDFEKQWYWRPWGPFHSCSGESKLTFERLCHGSESSRKLRLNGHGGKPLELNAPRSRRIFKVQFSNCCSRIRGFLMWKKNGHGEVKKCWCKGLWSCNHIILSEKSILKLSEQKQSTSQLFIHFSPDYASFNLLV